MRPSGPSNTNSTPTEMTLPSLTEAMSHTTRTAPWCRSTFMMYIPLSLDPRWGFVVLVPTVVGLVFRILDEEKRLEQQPAGCSEYKRKLHYRLLPYVW